ncbi:DnaJ-domain-containing protein [Trametes versicolor FP-101664 SS1]|uniref:DnaJ-domain-containing protein n=1 Tax=Trametes versicolor (strain FP-101664) TaxID=717944 RepID=UPI000462412E|nr:DnaJ-domain-containing protein [Trametes versicolor FP-101664 SS1]EIW61980.1 DnaJ-domain-containing protein [Trametes versicolor FP-101664 SS1]
MRILHLVAFLAVLVTAVVAWTKEDHEIFDLVSAIESTEGKGTTFYSWLNIPPTATTNEVSKAYRKKSLQLHPDKNKGVKNAHERFARLGVVAAILRNAEKRERYDFFYKNGVPKWRGTGYYYSRFRPGIGTVLSFLVILTSGLQYLVQKMNYNRDVKRVQQIMDQARAVAWGTKGTPIEGQRKVKVNLGGGARMDDDGNVVAGRWLDLVVEGESVFILEPDGSLLPVDSDTAVAPSIKGTWFLSLVTSLVQKVGKRDGAKINGASTEPEGAGEDSDGGSGTASDAPGSGTVTPKEGGGARNGRAAATSMAGGRRRKAVAARRK